jgi:transcriptional regulator with XRE-family HTH domain
VFIFFWDEGDMTFGARLKQLRELAGLSQNELAKRAGISRPIISQLEADQQRTTSVETARRLARALGISLDLLVGTDDDASEWAPAALAGVEA